MQLDFCLVYMTENQGQNQAYRCIFTGKQKMQVKSWTSDHSHIALQLALPKTKHLSESNSQILSWTSRPHHVLFLFYPLSLSSLPTLSQKAFGSQAPSLSSGFSLSSVIKALILLMAIEIITSFQSIQTKNTHVKTDM